MMRSRFRGVIILVALFVAWFVMLLATALIATTSYDFDQSQGSINATACRYASFGAVNQLIWDLDDGLKFDTYTKDNPLRTTEGGRTVESWVEPLTEGGTSSHSKTVVVAARASYPGEGRADVVRRLVEFEPDTSATVYTDVLDTNPNTPAAVYYSQGPHSTVWGRLPNVPRERYTASGQLESKPGQPAGCLPFICGSPDGSVYALYVPAFDGWGDVPAAAYFPGIPIPVTLPWGSFGLKTIVTGSHEGLTVDDLAPIAQVMVGCVTDVTVSNGAVMLRYSRKDGQWKALPPAEEARLVNGKFAVQPGDYHVQGAAGPPAAYDGGVAVPIYRKGQDAIYNYREATGRWTILKPPGTDVLTLASDYNGTIFVQTGQLQPVGIGYLLKIVLGQLTDIYANTATSKLSEYKNGAWTSIPNPPARFFDRSGQLVKSRYPGSRGPTLDGMAGGGKGQLYVINHPSNPGLVDTVYKYSGGAWQVVPSPPNDYYNSYGFKVDGGGLPPKLEAGAGAKGKLILRVPAPNGSDGIFLLTSNGYSMLPAVRTDGGATVRFTSQMSGGLVDDGSGRRSSVVRATYF